MMINKKPTREQLFYQKYLLTGAGIGLYFGVFFRPLREPSFGFAVVLAVIATIVTQGLTAFRKKQMPPITRVFLSFGQYLLITLAFEARHLAFDLGGRVGAIALSVLTGVLVALSMAYFKLNNPEETA